VLPVVPIIAALAPLLPLLSSVAPALGRLLAGRNGESVATAAAGAIEAVAGSLEPAAVAAALGDPAKAGDLAIRLAELEARAEEERLRMALADVASARTHTVELARVGSPIAYGAVIVSTLVLLAYAGVVTLAVLRPIPTGSEELLSILLGSLSTMAGAVVAYWVGSSAGSARNGEAVRRIAESSSVPFGPGRPS
jgi:hypothetical protein